MLYTYPNCSHFGSSILGLQSFLILLQALIVLPQPQVLNLRIPELDAQAPDRFLRIILKHLPQASHV